MKLTAISVSALLLALASCATPEENALIDKVRLAIFRDPVLVGYPIDVAAADHTIFMTGSVSTQVMIDHATKVAAAVPGVDKVVNSIEIENPAGF